MKSFGDIKIGSFWKLKEEFEGMIWNLHDQLISDDKMNNGFPPWEINNDVYELVNIEIKDTSDQRTILAVFKGINLEYIFAWNIDNIKDYLDYVGNKKELIQTLYQL